ncbi:MAG: 23S rRNA (adenine(2503)-C(2))-methyltransferase RlmN [Bdellovibrionales bacterium]|nr:23S rRNA (adenine(2503)-C(2))-methyltransferase RlmN [Bdellovibrionales bacterium]
MTDNKISFYQYSFKELQEFFRANSLNIAQASLLFRHYYKEKNTSFCDHHNFSKGAQELVKTHLDFTLPEIDIVHESSDSTVKLLVKLKDGQRVESVLIPFQNKYTICISTQVGCAMKCSFCFTGTQGLKRHLKTDEIIGQFILAWKWLEKNRPNDHQLKNIVYMGQGEPLHNFDAVKKASEIFLDQNGMSLGIQKITVSTAGYLPGLKRWNDEMPGVNIALSLHSVFEEKRNKLIPINERYPLPEVMDYIDSIPLARKQYVIYEYLLIKDFNDTEADAEATGAFLKGRQAIINLIPFNPFPGSEFERSEDAKILRFKAIIESYNLPALIRTTKGDDILAACGQLNTKVKNPENDSKVVP